MPSKGTPHRPEALGANGSIARGTRRGIHRAKILGARVAELEAALYAVQPRDLSILRESGALPERLQPFADAACATIQRLRLAAEGEPGAPSYRPLSEQRQVLLQNAERMLLLGMAETARSVTADDSEAASRAATILGRFGNLVERAVGLDPRETEVDLAAYLAQRERPENGAGSTIGSTPAGAVGGEGERSEARNQTGGVTAGEVRAGRERC